MLISAGFDSAAGDETGYNLTPKGYYRLTQMLASLPSVNGRVVAVLEGGYNIPAVAFGMEAVVAALLKPNQHSEQSPAPAELALADMQATVEALKPHWACLRE